MNFDFSNSQGETLSGRLELPDGDKPKAVALLAHCFTCSKDLIASRVISRTLTRSGIAVLRFDFTGIGRSEGEFSDTNFSSNVEDLIAACDALKKTEMAPKILIGHSLGGAAVLQAAKSLEGVRAVVTVAAPCSAQHVEHLFCTKIDEIKKDGFAKVSLGAREFTIKKQFIDDIEGQKVLEGLSSIKKALLVLHSPVDKTVGIEHAAKIFEAAKHPKSFVSLDGADHLLMDKASAEYAGGIIGAWVQRYI